MLLLAQRDESYVLRVLPEEQQGPMVLMRQVVLSSVKPILLEALLSLVVELAAFAASLSWAIKSMSYVLMVVHLGGMVLYRENFVQSF